MNFRTKVIKILVVLLLVAFNQSVLFSQEPNEFIRSVANEASQIIAGSGNKETKMQKLKEVAKKSVDIKGLGSYTLGGYKKEISENQKQEYYPLFEKYFLKTFASRLIDYTDPKVNVISQKKINEKYTIVSSILVATEKRPEIKIDWRVYTVDPENPLIRDLIIEGLSLARTQREEFSSIIQSNDGNIDALFVSLKNFINK